MSQTKRKRDTPVTTKEKDEDVNIDTIIVGSENDSDSDNDVVNNNNNNNNNAEEEEEEEDDGFESSPIIGTPKKQQQSPPQPLAEKSPVKLHMEDLPACYQNKLSKGCGTQSVSIKYLVTMFKSGELVVPEWQRSANVWSMPQKRCFIDSIFRSYSIPIISVYDDTGKGGSKTNVVDGLQRLSTLRQFMDNEFAFCPGEINLGWRLPLQEQTAEQKTKKQKQKTNTTTQKTTKTNFQKIMEKTITTKATGKNEAGSESDTESETESVSEHDDANDDDDGDGDGDDDTHVTVSDTNSKVSVWYSKVSERLSGHSRARKAPSVFVLDESLRKYFDNFQLVVTQSMPGMDEPNQLEYFHRIQNGFSLSTSEQMKKYTNNPVVRFLHRFFREADADVIECFKKGLSRSVEYKILYYILIARMVTANCVRIHTTEAGIMRHFDWLVKNKHLNLALLDAPELVETLVECVHHLNEFLAKIKKLPHSRRITINMRIVLLNYVWTNPDVANLNQAHHLAKYMRSEHDFLRLTRRMRKVGKGTGTVADMCAMVN